MNYNQSGEIVIRGVGRRTFEHLRDKLRSAGVREDAIKFDPVRSGGTDE